MGTQLPLPQRGTDPQFSAHICCGQMAAWIKMSLDIELGLGLGDCVKWGPRSPYPKRGGGGAPKFSAHVYCGQTPGWIKMALGTKVGLSPDDSVRWGPSSPPQKGGRAPKFSAHLYCGQTAGCIKNFDSKYHLVWR